jgi:hypothetical protein
MLNLIKCRLFGIPSKKGNDLKPKGTISTVIPSVFIDGNKNPIWDNNHKLIQGNKKIIL